MSDQYTLSDEVSNLASRLDILWGRSETQRANEAFTPLSKSPFLRLREKVRQVAERPTSGRMINTPTRALVISTIDPLMRGRVRIYCSRIHAHAPEHMLPWANVSMQGGSIDDAGQVWLPPAGSNVIVDFEAGDREAPVVRGGVRILTRGTGGFDIIEEHVLWGGNPGRRVDKKNTKIRPDTNDLPMPWRCEMYDRADGDNNTSKSPPPFIHGEKTPRKHYLKFVDGNVKKELKGTRVELKTAKGGILFGKDDVLQSPSEIYENKMMDDLVDCYPGLLYDKRPYNDHAIELKHTGWQLQSVGGGRLIISDEVEKDIFNNDWNAGFQVNGMLRTFVALESITGHQLILRESEKEETIRNQYDGIFAISACGNFIGLRDDTIGSNQGGFQRGILLWSTSDHTIEMNDYTVKNASPRAPSGGVQWRKGKPSKEEMQLSYGAHTPNATQAFIRIRSGWGQIMEFNDYGSQEDNAQQFILIRNENKEEGMCPDNGPPWNFIRMECVVANRLFHIWGAGDYTLQVCNHILRISHKGNDITYLEKGSKFIFLEEGFIWDHCLTGIVHWTTFNGIYLIVGRIIEEKLEFPYWPVIIAKGLPYACPITGHLHFDEPSNHVFASE